MQLVEVKNIDTAKEFIGLPVKLYKDEKEWIRPIDKDIEEDVFGSKNKFFRHGKAIRWILQNDTGETIGRVAAFINNKTVNKTDVKTGGMGFFESIEDKEAAFLLFDKCKEWLKEEGVEAMDGPINFGERDKWWGLLVDGFVEPNYCMPYNFKYYQPFFEEYGFQVYFKQYTFNRPVNHQLQPIWLEKARRINENKDYHFNHYKRKQHEEYGEYFRIVYNEAWAGHSGVSKMSKVQAKSVMDKLKPILDPELIWFSFYKKEPIGFFIMFPELNQTFKHVNGKLDWLGKLKFVYYKWKKPSKKVFGVAFGIVPDHQGKGVEGAMVDAAANWVQPKARYETLEMNWIGDFNPKMIHICESLGAEVIKTHHTYRYLFDREKEFHRAPIMK